MQRRPVDRWRHARARVLRRRQLRGRVPRSHRSRWSNLRKAHRRRRGRRFPDPLCESSLRHQLQRHQLQRHRRLRSERATLQAPAGGAAQKGPLARLRARIAPDRIVACPRLQQCVSEPGVAGDFPPRPASRQRASETKRTCNSAGRPELPYGRAHVTLRASTALRCARLCVLWPVTFALRAGSCAFERGSVGVSV